MNPRLSAWVAFCATILVTGCYAPPQGIPFVPGASCAFQGVSIQIEAGLDGCGVYAAELQGLRAIYEDQWDPVDLTGWTIYVTKDVPTWQGKPHVGLTFWSDRRVYIWTGGLVGFPHELHHVDLGPSSIDHHGWCQGFAQWELQVDLLNELGYLGCPP